MRRSRFSMLCLLILVCAPAAGSDEIPRQVLEAVQEARLGSGAESLLRRPELDQAAGIRAERIAALPHKQRLAIPDGIDPVIRDAGIRTYRQSRIHTDMVRGHIDSAAAFLRSWRRYPQLWEVAMDPDLDSIGLASRVAADGWVILVTVFLEELKLPTDVAALERSAFEAINEIRGAEGLSVLSHREELSVIARGHSEAMSRHGFFDHTDHRGRQAEDRVTAHGLSFARLAENIQKNRGSRDPALSAVESWMANPSHRSAILTPEYRESGIGVAIAEDGTFFFTQMFYTAPASRDP